MNRTVATSAALILTLAACKQQTGSDVQSLDNFAAGSRVSTNVCSGDPRLANDPALKQILDEVTARTLDKDSSPSQHALNIKALRDAFSAVPPSMQAQFLALGGRVLISKHAHTICTDGMLQSIKKGLRDKADLKVMTENLSEINSCYLFMAPGEVQVRLNAATDTPLYAVVVKNDPREIAHGLVRTFGYMAAQLSPRLATDGGFTSSTAEVGITTNLSPAYANAREAVARAFLEDLKGKPAYATFAKFAGARADEAQRVTFQDYVYAEAFDSYFCNQHAKDSKNTLAKMGKEFPKTLLAFVASLDQKTSGFGLAGSSQGFGLWGNPFTWVGEKWSNYTKSRDAIIQKLTDDVMSNNGGKPPGFIDTLSIAANGAWRPVADAPLVGDVVGPAVKYTDAIAGATINNEGQTALLTDSQRARLAGSATFDVASNLAIGELSSVVGGKAGAAGATKLGDAVFSETGTAVVKELNETALGRGLNAVVTKPLIKYGDQAVEWGVGKATEKGIDYIGGKGAEGISGIIAGPQPFDPPATTPTPQPTPEPTIQAEPTVQAEPTDSAEPGFGETDGSIGPPEQ